MGSIVLPHLQTAWHVDQAILSEEERLVVIRFGRDHDPDCIRQDELLYKIAERVKNFAVIYLCDVDQVPDFNTMYELYDRMTIMFFYRNKHMMCDFGTGNNNKLNWVLEDKQELIDIIETIYKGAKKGRGLVVSPKGMFYFPCTYWLNSTNGYGLVQITRQDTGTRQGLFDNIGEYGDARRVLTDTSFMNFTITIGRKNGE
ncbi:uncharacterized protein N7483_001292 [Penicillium malachiteum]|uniref:uncharacterized protein n=1 Tax=Penicillium malachiteum TaxID=1324776 RepID=UPI002547E2BC|nr:uncharacterized protein N7483_001292 [Penicillium malachiteum]KAJ5736167.1 hypothetical protein N7483_001292 [Penicillium malachiteum]